MRNSSLKARFRLAPVLLLVTGVCLAAALVWGPVISPAAVVHSAGTINVTTTTDEFNNTPNATCSLREAIESINTNSSFGGCINPGEADTIQLGANTYQVSIPYVASNSNSEGSLAPRTSMTIQGQGAAVTVVDASPLLNSSVFDVQISVQPVVFTMMGLAVQGGPKRGVVTQVTGSGAAGSQLTFSNLLVEDNHQTGMYFSVPAEDVQVTIRDVIIRNNNVTNSSYYGGGLSIIYGGLVEVSTASIYNNGAFVGAGIYYRSQYSGDYLNATNVTLYNNRAEVSGGGLYAAGASPQGVTLTNVTFDKNQAWTGTGGSIYTSNATVRLVNTIVADGKISGGTLWFNCDGSPSANITSLGHNLASDGTCGLNASGDQENLDPMFAGGLTGSGNHPPVVPLVHNSPAVDTGDNSACPAVDQRGVSRPQGPGCDIGAYEFEPPTADDIVVTGAADTDIEITLQGHDPQSDPLLYWIDSLPAKGSLYQYDNGNRGDQFTVVPEPVSDAGHRVIFAPEPDQGGRPYATFEYYVHDGTSRSAAATVNVDVMRGWVFVPIVMKQE